MFIYSINSICFNANNVFTSNFSEIAHTTHSDLIVPCLPTLTHMTGLVLVISCAVCMLHVEALCQSSH